MEKLYEKYMFVIGSCSSLVFYLQALKIFTERTAVAISLPAFLIGLVSVISWLIYGVLIKNRVLVVSNTIATIGATWVVIGILLYQA